MPIVNVQRRVDGNLVYGSVNDVTNMKDGGQNKPPQFNVPGAVAAPSNALLESIGNLEVRRKAKFFINKHFIILFPFLRLYTYYFHNTILHILFQAENKLAETELIEEEPGFLDSVLGDGVQSRIVTSLNDWILDKARTNPGCVERFVCETYRTGETLNGIPYLAMQMTK